MPGSACRDTLRPLHLKNTRELMNRTDQHLARAYVQGEADAVRTIDAWIGASLWSFQRRLAAACEDAAQDARVELLKRLGAGEFRGDAGLKTYVWRVTTHAAITRIRRDTVRRVEPLDQHADISTSEPTPLDELLKTDSDSVVRRVLAECGAPCRELWGWLLEGRSYAEISAHTGVSEGALRVRVLRCRQAAVRARASLRSIPAETNPPVERLS